MTNIGDSLNTIIKGAFGVAEATPVERKRSSPTKTVANAVVFHTDQRAKALEAKMKVSKTKLDSENKDLEKKQKKVRVLAAQTSKLEQRYTKMVQTARNSLAEEYRKEITKIKMMPEVERFEVDKDKRIIITTKAISVQKPDWEKPRVAGKYQIRIDFSEDDIDEGIRILNITQRDGEHDSPTISDTCCCWGNIEDDLQEEFNNQDLHEMVCDIIAYIASVDDSAGFTRWGYFFRDAKPTPSGYCFAMWDQAHESTRVRNVTGVARGGSVVFDETIAYPTTMTRSDALAAYNQMQRQAQMQAYTTQYQEMVMSTMQNQGSLGSVGYMGSTGTSMAYPSPLRDEQRNLTAGEYDLYRELMRAGLVERAAYYYLGLITSKLSANDAQGGSHQVEIREYHGELRMFFDNFVPFFCNQDDFESRSVLENLHRGDRFVVSFGNRRPRLEVLPGMTGRPILDNSFPSPTEFMTISPEDFGISPSNI